MQPLGARPLPGQGGLHRVAVGGLGAGLAVDEADRLSVTDVDGGKEFETVGAHRVAVLKS
ncbi:hypothetical protein GCM10010420_51020 [Streptomyces glaucosporus]|uniref:Uncharacterized protein n=1 Tax=Streptomyces glaucosporus TaxID=284044 RepID=A0ABN3IVD0_9ACTN